MKEYPEPAKDFNESIVQLSQAVENLADALIRTRNRINEIESRVEILTDPRDA